MSGQIGQINREILDAVKKNIYKGNSRLKEPLQNNEINLYDVIIILNMAKDKPRCITTNAGDLGSTYLEQQIGNAIRDSIPRQWLNYSRSIFGLEKLKSKMKFTDAELNKLRQQIQKKKQSQQ